MNLVEEPMRPSEFLKELNLDPLDIRATAFARHLDVPRTRIERLIKRTIGIVVSGTLA